MRLLTFLTLLVQGLSFAHGAVPIQQPDGPPPLVITLEQALEKARANSLEFQSARIGVALAREDRVQARATLLPSLNSVNQYIYTSGNGTDTGRFVGNNGVHEYVSQAAVHADMFSPVKRADYRRAVAQEELLRARLQVAERGLLTTVVAGYYGLVSDERKLANARLSRQEAGDSLNTAEALERGGEVAHADVVKAQLLVEERERDVQEAQLTVERARVGLSVLLFPDFTQTFSVVDDLDKAPPLPEFDGYQAASLKENPELTAAEANVRSALLAVSGARAAFWPTFSLDYFWGIDANQFAAYNPEHLRNLGSAAAGTLSIPVFNWGESRSRVRQAELRLEQARLEAGLTQRQVNANIRLFYAEASSAQAQLASLNRAAALAVESLRLTLLRYRSGDATIFEISDAQAAASQARNAYADGLVRYWTALAQLRTLTGGPLR